MAPADASVHIESLTKLEIDGENNMTKTTFRWLRLASCGAIVGAALGNVVAQHFGLQMPFGHAGLDAFASVSAVIGAGTTAALVKVIHLV